MRRGGIEGSDIKRCLKYCESSIKPSLSNTPPTFKGKKVNKPPSSPSYYALLINGRLY